MQTYCIEKRGNFFFCTRIGVQLNIRVEKNISCFFFFLKRKEQVDQKNTKKLLIFGDFLKKKLIKRNKTDN